MGISLLVLAAGMGSRYGGLKQLDEVGPSGETIIDYSIYDAMRAGFTKVVFIIRRDIEEAFKQQIGARYESKIEVAYVFQELDALPDGFTPPEGRSKPWGTGQAILCAASAINEPFAVINGDDFYGADSFKVAAEYLKTSKDAERADYSMVSFILRNTLSDFGSVCRGVCECDDKQSLVGVTECCGIEREGNGAVYTDDNDQKHHFTGDEPVSMNMWGFTPSIFENIESQFVDFLKERGQEEKSEFYIPSVVNTMLQADTANVHVLRSEAQWFGVTYREDKQFVQDSVAAMCKEGAYPSPLWQ